MNQPNQPPILVLGAGIIGLSSAVCLSKAGFDVQVLSQETPQTIFDRDSSSLSSTPPQLYASSGAGGLWKPIFLEGAEVEKWARKTLSVFLSEKSEASGVRMHECFVVRKSNNGKPLPWWAEITSMRVITRGEDKRLPEGYGSALLFTAPIVHMKTYLCALEEKLKNLGVSVKLTSEYCNNGEDTAWTGDRVLDFIRSTYREALPIVVNCCGIGAGKVSAEDMEPLRGVLVTVKKPRGVNWAIAEDPTDGLIFGNGLAGYCIPKGDSEYSLGGTALPGDWRTEVTEDEKLGVLERAGKLINGIDKEGVVGLWSGLRPMRKDQRARLGVQEEGLSRIHDLSGKVKVVANYGHGGNGITTCWGCAEEVVTVVEGLLKS